MFLVISLDFAANILLVAHYYLIYALILPGSYQTEVKVTGLYEVTRFLVHHRWTCSRISLLSGNGYFFIILLVNIIFFELTALDSHVIFTDVLYMKQSYVL